MSVHVLTLVRDAVSIVLTIPFWTAPLATTSTMSPTLYCLRYVPSAIIPFFLKSREKANQISASDKLQHASSPRVHHSLPFHLFTQDMRNSDATDHSECPL